jgi:FlaA1/EpsC-like NDP-sugar epimerase
MTSPTAGVEREALPKSLRVAGWLGGLYVRRALVVALYALVLYFSRWLAYQLRFEFDVPELYRHQIFERAIWYIPLQLVVLAVFGQFSGILRYFGLREARRLFYALALSALALHGIGLLATPGDRPPRSVIVLGSLLGFLFLGGLRAAWRSAASWETTRRLAGTHTPRRLGIIGAGDAGADLIRDLKERPRFGLVPVALFDDDSAKWRAEIHGIPVVGSPNELETWAARLRLDEVVIAMPSAPPRRIREIVALAQQADLRAVTLPSLGQLAAGHVRVSQLRPVKFEDVLGRDPVDLRLEEIRPLLHDRVVLVTGAGGSIGSELCRQAAGFQPRRLLLVEQSEGALFLIEQEMIKLGHGRLLVPIVADIAERERMNAVLAGHQPGVIFHAAAHKHVPMMERQPSEAIKNNTFGTIGLANLAREHGVGHFVLISTDKAVNPTSVMGATKRLAEIYLQALAAEAPGGTKFIAVRFGNVLGSSGSVVPIFAQQIAEGGPVTVTDPGVVRYFMTIPEAVGLVLQSFALGQGGEIFVLEMGSPVRIVDMAETMIRLSGFEPGRDIEIQFTGLRPGEKLFEELVHDGATHDATSHPRIMRLKSQPQGVGELRARLEGLRLLLHRNQPEELKRALRKLIPEYTPYFPAAASAPTAGVAGVSGPAASVPVSGNLQAQTAGLTATGRVP